MAIHIRWLLRRDLPTAIQLDYLATGADYRNEESYLALLRQRNAIGMVAEEGGKFGRDGHPLPGSGWVMKGVMVYELHKPRLNLLRMVVHPEFQRAGVGTAMINRMKDKLWTGRHTITTEVDEHNDAGIAFLAACGFRGEQAGDSIDFSYSVRQPRECEVEA